MGHSLLVVSVTVRTIMLRSVIVGAVVTLSIVGLTVAVPQCSGDCSDGYCPTTCYTNEENLVCSCETKFGGQEVECKKPDESACTGVEVNSGFGFDECQGLSDSNAESNAFIFDTNIFGPRCRLIKECQTMAEAAVAVPCSDCESGRSCSTCPRIAYTAVTTSVHWICQSAVGDPYTHQMVEGTTCTVTHECDEVLVKTISCSSPENPGEDGVWMNADDQSIVEPEDVQCKCNPLRIPGAEDTNVFCEPEVIPDENGDYILMGNERCDVVCDGSVFIPVSCKFDKEDKVAWHVSYGGEDIALTDGIDCFACSFDTCSANISTNPTDAPTSPATSAAAAT